MKVKMESSGVCSLPSPNENLKAISLQATELVLSEDAGSGTYRAPNSVQVNGEDMEITCKPKVLEGL